MCATVGLSLTQQWACADVSSHLHAFLWNMLATAYDAKHLTCDRCQRTATMAATCRCRQGHAGLPSANSPSIDSSPPLAHPTRNQQIMVTDGLLHTLREYLLVSIFCSETWTATGHVARGCVSFEAPKVIVRLIEHIRHWKIARFLAEQSSARPIGTLIAWLLIPQFF